MTVITRKRVVPVALVAAFVAVFLGIGAVSRPTPTAASPVVSTTAPSSPWYWAMAVSPSDADVLLLATSSGLFRSSNGGKTWKPTGPKRINATSLVQTGSSIIVGGLRLAPGASPNPVIRKGSFRTVPDGSAALAVTADGGKSWRELHPRGLPDVAVQALAVDPTDTMTVYALLNTGKLFRSTDGAGSFKLVSSKLGVPPWALAIAQDGQFVAGNMDSGHFVSRNGKAWTKTPYTDSKGASHVMAYAVQPTDLTRVLMTSTGVEMSTDSGKTWHVVLKSDAMFGPIAWSPTESGVAFAVGFDRSVWRSDDDGESWTKVS